MKSLAALGHPPPDSTLAFLADTCLRRRFEGFEGQVREGGREGREGGQGREEGSRGCVS